MTKRAFAIYECDHGWCVEPLYRSDNNFFVELKTYKARSSVFAFSRITQALWWLGRRVKERDQSKGGRDE